MRLASNNHQYSEELMNYKYIFLIVFTCGTSLSAQLITPNVGTTFFFECGGVVESGQTKILSYEKGIFTSQHTITLKNGTSNRYQTNWHGWQLLFGLYEKRKFQNADRPNSILSKFTGNLKLIEQLDPIVKLKGTFDERLGSQTSRKILKSKLSILTKKFKYFGTLRVYKVETDEVGMNLGAGKMTTIQTVLYYSPKYKFYVRNEKSSSNFGFFCDLKSIKKI